MLRRANDGGKTRKNAEAAPWRVRRVGARDGKLAVPMAGLQLCASADELVASLVGLQGGVRDGGLASLLHIRPL